MSTIDSVIGDLLREAELDIHCGIVTDADVYRVAEGTDCDLPPDYVAFLRRCGFAFWVGHAVNGVYDETDDRFPNSYNFSAVRQTAAARQLHAGHPYPELERSVVIGKDDMGGYFLLVSAAVVTPKRVLWVNSDEDWVVTNSWASFTEFLAAQLTP